MGNRSKGRELGDEELQSVRELLEEADSDQEYREQIPRDVLLEMLRDCVATIDAAKGN